MEFFTRSKEAPVYLFHYNVNGYCIMPYSDESVVIENFHYGDGIFRSSCIYGIFIHGSGDVVGDNWFNMYMRG